MTYFKFSFVKVRDLCLSSFFFLFFFQDHLLKRWSLLLGSSVKHQLAFVSAHSVWWHQMTTDWTKTSEGLSVLKAGTRRWVGRYLEKAFILANFCVALTKELIPFIISSVEKSKLWAHMWRHRDIGYRWVEEVSDRDVTRQDQSQEWEGPNLLVCKNQSAFVAHSLALFHWGSHNIVPSRECPCLWPRHL